MQNEIKHEYSNGHRMRLINRPLDGMIIYIYNLHTFPLVDNVLHGRNNECK